MTIPRGNDGIAPVFSTSTSTSTLSAGSSATASISGSGTSSNPYKFSFGIPRGNTGSQGSTGPAGSNGISNYSNGYTGYIVFGNGLKVQWVQHSLGLTSVTFPISFNSACYAVFRVATDDASKFSSNDYMGIHSVLSRYSVISSSKTSVTIGTSSGKSSAGSILAIGY